MTRKFYFTRILPLQMRRFTLRDIMCNCRWREIAITQREYMNHTQPTRRKRRRSPGKPDRVMLGLLGAFVIAALITAFLAFKVIRDLVATTTAFEFEGVGIQAPAGEEAAQPGEEGAAPVQSGR